MEQKSVNCMSIRATNENADRFYKKFENVQLDEEPMLRKILKED